MKPLLLTMNTDGTWMPPNVTASHEAAAQRWGCQYLQLTGPTKNYFFEKHLAMFALNSDLIWLDGDCIVRYDCPNPFNSAGDFCAVSGLQGQSENAEGLAHDWHDVACAFLNLRIPFNPTRYVNGGLLVAWQKHRRVWEYVLQAHKTPSAMLEQTLLNLALSDELVQILPNSFNAVGPAAWKPGPMTQYIQHLAGVQGIVQDKREALAGIDWTCKT